MIAALADAVVVGEAAARFGALNTAHHAGQLGRQVFAVPGAFSQRTVAGAYNLTFSAEWVSA